MYGAIKDSTTGLYSIVPAYPSYKSTYNIRHKLKELGGIWDADNNVWTNIEERFLKNLLASKRFRVILSPHTGVSDKPMEIVVFEHQIVNNQVKMLDWGDSHVWVNVQEILGEG